MKIRNFITTIMIAIIVILVAKVSKGYLASQAMTIL